MKKTGLVILGLLTLSTFINYSPAINLVRSANAQTSAGLTDAWHFDESSGSALDSGAGAVTWVPLATGMRTSGVVGNAALFDGTGDTIYRTAKSTDLQFQATDNITLSIWIKPTDTGRAQFIFATDDVNYAAYSTIYLFLESQVKGRQGPKNFVYFDWVNPGPSDQTVESTAAIPFGQWTNIAVVKQGTNTLRLYINGALNNVASVSMAGKVTGSCQKWLGAIKEAVPACGRTGAYYFNGAMDEFLIYNRVLSDKEIQNLVTSTSTASTSTTSSSTSTSTFSTSTASASSSPSSGCASSVEGSQVNTGFEWALKTIINKGVGVLLGLPKWASLGTGVFLSVITKQPVGNPPMMSLYGGTSPTGLSHPFLRYMIVNTGSPLYWQERFSIGDVIGRPTLSVLQIQTPILAGFRANGVDIVYSAEETNPNNPQGYFTIPCLLYAIPSQSLSFNFTQPGLYDVKAGYGSGSDIFGTDIWHVIVFGKSISSGTAIILSEQAHKLYLNVYDSQGRHVGYNSSTGNIDNSIPGAQYADLNNTIIVTLPSTDGFRYSVDARSAQSSEESYSLGIAAYRNGQVSAQSAANYTIGQGTVSEATVQISPDTSQITIQQASTTGSNFPLIIGGIAAVGVALTAVVIIRRRHHA